MATVLEADEIRRAHSIAARVDEVSEEVNAERKRTYCENLESVVLNCISLATQWRSILAYCSTSMEAGRNLYYRALGAILLPAAQKTQQIFEDIN